MSAATGTDRAESTDRFVARAAAVTAALTAAGAVVGLLRDQIIATLFGAGPATDAFLVAWTVPEFAATLLIEEGAALVLVPAFSLALARAGAGGARELCAATFPRLLLALAVAAAALAAGARPLVAAHAPGLAERGLAVDCVRLPAVSVLTFGVAGYFSAALRAHRDFVPPAAIYVVHNAGILATALALHAWWGIRAAAAGVALGGALMALVQLPFFLRRFLRGRPRGTPPAPSSAPVRAGGRVSLLAGVSVGVVAPVALFALSRQSQVLVERCLASALPAGAISHLNYAQKVAQMPMVLSMMICTVTLPLVARAVADGETERARERVERDLVLAGVVVLLGGAFVVACAPAIIELLFQRGAFDERATAATAGVMRVYALGLLGHTLAGALTRPFFSAARPAWFPLAAMALGLLITVAGGLAAVPVWGVRGIAAANAAGISVTALLLLRALPRRTSIPVDARRVLGRLARLAVAAALAAGAGWAATALPGCSAPLPAVALGCLLVPAVFAVAACALRVPEAALLVSALKQRLDHARCH
ncbi:lipid II flippase MurJ [Streptomyces specialis]|uniref:lipid II flippase MurJ n=1 Tax=Streptomyces specialis TaxID=498367 RepID=UPI00073E6322|nr:lipid II flippase MurJ [Streptomyces specialis]